MFTVPLAPEALGEEGDRLTALTSRARDSASQKDVSFK